MTLLYPGARVGDVVRFQTTITRRGALPPRRGFVAMLPGEQLTILGQPLLGEFVRVSPWAFPDPGTFHSITEVGELRARCHSLVGAGMPPARLSLAARRQILIDCAQTLLPGRNNAGAYRESAVTADLRLPVAR